MKRVLAVYLIFILGFTGVNEIVRVFLNKSYKNYYKLEVTEEKLLKVKEDLDIIYLDYEIKNLKLRNETNMIIIHHCGREIWSPEDINQFHKEKGWDGIGYNFYIRKDGTIYNCRGEGAIGAQVKGYNDVSIGICLEGNFEIEEPKEVQIDSLDDLIYYLINKYEVKEIKGHKDYGETLCPGKNFKINIIKNNILKKIRNKSA